MPSELGYSIDDLFDPPLLKALAEPVPNAQSSFADAIGTYTLPSQSLSSQALPIQDYAPADGATATLDLRKGNDHRVQIAAANGDTAVLAVKNATVGQRFLVSVTQGAGGNGTVTWFDTIRWADGSEPLLSAVAGKRDTLGFICTGAGTFDGFIVGLFI